ncbi:MAG: BBP7 family outer membrane beta-barrel protein [Planctomycetaceae bacterium]|nr:BBP7 family outer membrane beta-barrel protein [Planctomycetaceae bacterium]
MRKVGLLSLVLGTLVLLASARAQECCNGGSCRGAGYGSGDCSDGSCDLDACYSNNYGCGPFLPDYYEPALQGTYVTADFVAFLRDRQPYQVFATQNNSTHHVFDTDNLDFVFQPGLRLLVGRRFTECWALEGSFLGLFKWDEQNAIRDASPNIHATTGNLFSPLTRFGSPAVIGLDFNTLVAARLQSQFNNAELNFRQQLYSTPPAMQISALYGFRYINLREQFQFQSESLLPLPTGTANSVDVRTGNNLYGVQLGGAFDLQLYSWCWFNIEAKGMIFGNSESQNTQFTTGPIGGPGTTLTSGLAQTRATLGADVSVTLVWAFTPRLLGRVGYQGIFLDGLALAANNFARNAPFLTTGPTQLDRDGHLTFQGPFAGLTLTW